MKRTVQIGEYSFIQTQHDLQHEFTLDCSDFFELAQHILGVEKRTPEEEKVVIDTYFSQYAPLSDGSSVKELADFTYLMRQ